MQIHAFHISLSTSIEEAWETLQAFGCELLYSQEECAEPKQLIGYLPSQCGKDQLHAACPMLIQIKEFTLPEIDWDAQWAEHASNYQDGFVHIQINEHFSFRLKPGPGFGDLSHPTTRLILRHMREYVRWKHVIDIGCGSGILSLAAAFMEAYSVDAIDIDHEVLAHALENAHLNNMHEQITFAKPENSLIKFNSKECVVLMNMIESEQIQAWNSLTQIHGYTQTILTSGILVEGRNSYLKQCKDWNWRLQSEFEEDGWLGFVFSKN